MSSIPQHLKIFCEKYQIPIEQYSKASLIPRYVRFRPNVLFANSECFDEDDFIEKELERQLKLLQENNYIQHISVSSVSWFPRKCLFFSLEPQHLRLNGSKWYDEGRMCGMDISSAVAILALHPQQNQSILDLCCAPGAKLCFISDYIQLNAKDSRNSKTNNFKTNHVGHYKNHNVLSKGESLDAINHCDNQHHKGDSRQPHDIQQIEMSVEKNLQNDSVDFYLTGVDYNIDRMMQCRQMILKYKLKNTRLILADGTRFCIYNQDEPMRLRNNKIKQKLKVLRQKQSNEKPLSNDDLPDRGLIMCETLGTFMEEKIKRGQDKKKRKNDHVDLLEANSKRKKRQCNLPLNTRDANTTEAIKDSMVLDPSLANNEQPQSDVSHHTTIINNSSTSIASKHGIDGLNIVGEKEKEKYIESIQMYDKVIVDAECTTDGSVKHVLKIIANTNQNENLSNFFDEDRFNRIAELQKRLIYNGFRLVKPGGALVYSTCSFLKQQNEDVVQYLLDKVGNNACLEDPFLEMDDPPTAHGIHQICSKSFMQHTIRLDPMQSNTSGLFIAKIRKIR